ncbi:hypothetical protein CHS0354_040868 [Potamilus streckersoni]|uniref:ShKT domain-containing protein n=1 Tax=Potamilus streckersoni TaxID=2493646 RepID=A0AAE0SLU5_9BIVA|nr:hypothetical protein CHS0354_040868 [Potamilus streckersoni]
MDIDQTACQLLHAKEPNLCKDPVLSQACKRYCGQCPTVCNFCPHIVQDPSDCNETVTCSHGEVCYFMEVTDFDNHHGFKGGCISKDICK